MNWQSSRRAVISCVVLFLLASPLHASSDIERHLRDELQGKTFVLRGFYSGDHLHYDSGGTSVGDASSGDWMSDGFALVKGIRFSRNRLTIEAERLLVIELDEKEFQVLPEKDSETRKLKIEVTLNLDSLSPEQLDAAMAKIFLTAHDNLPALVSDYWRPCVLAAALAKGGNLRFSPELLTVPGVVPQESTTAPMETNASRGLDCNTVVHNKVGEGIPRPIYQPDPEFSESARHAKLHDGVVVLGLVVDEKGLPTNIHIVKPLGFGLEEKALTCVGKWRFKPAERDGRPVATKIVVEVDFHLY